MMKGLRINIRSEEPLILSDGRVDGSVHTAQNYIAGNKFLGALAGIWKARNSVQEVMDSPEFRSLFLYGGVSFGNGTLEHEGHRCLPMPLCFRSIKGSPSVINLLTEGLEAEDTSAALEGFLDAETGHVLRPHLVQAVHLNLMQGQKKIFMHGYETIEEGTRFMAVFYSQDACFEVLKTLLAPHETFQIGRSRSAGYGTVRITAQEELDLPETVKVSAGRHTFLLESSFLAEKSWQSPLESFLSLLGRFLGKVELVSEATFCAPARADGFNGAWNMPRFTRVGLLQGSVITVTTEKDGVLPVVLGHSLLEGYGRYLLDPPFLSQAAPALSYAVQESPLEVQEEDEVAVSEHLLQVWRRRSAQRLAHEQAVDCVWNSSIFTDFFDTLRSYTRPSQSQRSNIQRLITGYEREKWIPMFSSMLGKQPGREWKSVHPIDPFSSNRQRGNLHEIMLRLFDLEETNALMKAKFEPSTTLPEIPGQAMTGEEELEFRRKRHSLLLLEFLRRWEREARAREGEK